MLDTLAGVIVPVFFCVLCGYLWSRSGQPFDTAMVSRLVMTLGAPCLIISTLATVPVALTDLLDVLLAYALVQGLTLVLGLAWLKAGGLSWRHFFNAMLFPNVGNMGLPVCLLAFGEPGLALALGWFTVNSVLHFSLGIMVASGEWHPRHVLGNPVVMSAALALAMMAGGWSLPGWLVASLDLVGALTIPMMLITLGVSLAGLPWRGMGLALYVASGRLLVGLGSALIVIWWWPMPALVAAVVVIQSSMPVAVFNYLFAQRYQQAPEQMAATVMISTLLALVSLPLLLAWLLAGRT